MGKHRKIKICSYKRYTYILSAIKAFYNQSKVKWFPDSNVIELKSHSCANVQMHKYLIACYIFQPYIGMGFKDISIISGYKDVLYKKELSRLKMVVKLI